MPMIYALAALALAAEPPAEPIAWREAMEICRTFHLIDQEKGRAMRRDLSKEARDYVDRLCITYRQGMVDTREIDKAK